MIVNIIFRDILPNNVSDKSHHIETFEMTYGWLLASKEKCTGVKELESCLLRRQFYCFVLNSISYLMNETMNMIIYVFVEIYCW